MELKSTIQSIEPSDSKIKQQTKEKWDGLVKPLGSLGTLEELAIKISGITGKTSNKIDKKAIVVMASDNGVYEENVASAPQIVTSLLTEGMAKGITGVATLGKFVDADIITVDIGLNSDFSHERVINRKIANGTKNFTKESAMTYEEAIKSIEIGIEIGDKLYNEGYEIIGTGELGMANTSTSAAVLSVLSGLDVDITCGKGAGITEEQYAHKKNTIIKGIDLNKPNKEDPIDVLSKVGGFDIGGMCGLFLSGAKNRIPVVIDGFISSVAALCAVKLNSDVRDYIIPSHLSNEPGARYVLDELGLSPMLNMNMRLGEGSGCPLAFQIIDAALYTQDNMGTFQQATIDSTVLVDIREE
ncbi:MAG: nicotinate-nucleotide--dimethylbenzimidazole phosphoribosyltransferase [Tissierellaceae bacterium]|nr:nicotinate-nucleotide--dimethylbenzimidazole phosphoribosyltransferase [Tissierellaceae bacterium]